MYLLIESLCNYGIASFVHLHLQNSWSPYGQIFGVFLGINLLKNYLRTLTYVHIYRNTDPG